MVAGAETAVSGRILTAREAHGVIATVPFLSATSRKVCLATATRCPNSENPLRGSTVLEIDLAAMVEFVMGDVAGTSPPSAYLSQKHPLNCPLPIVNIRVNTICARH
jgi:hypothetical protein